jgi:hypothetical protein
MSGACRSAEHKALPACFCVEASFGRMLPSAVRRSTSAWARWTICGVPVIMHSDWHITVTPSDTPCPSLVPMIELARMVSLSLAYHYNTLRHAATRHVPLSVNVTSSETPCLVLNPMIEPLYLNPLGHRGYDGPTVHLRCRHDIYENTHSIYEPT